MLDLGKVCIYVLFWRQIAFSYLLLRPYLTASYPGRSVIQRLEGIGLPENTLDHYAAVIADLYAHLQSNWIAKVPVQPEVPSKINSKPLVNQSLTANLAPKGPEAETG